MRISINLPDSLFDAVRLHAQTEGRTFTSFVEEALRNALAAGPEPAAAPQLPTYGDSAGRFLSDPADRVELWTALDSDAAQ